MICPNINLKEWKSLVSTQGENLSYYLWNKFGGNVPDEYYRPNNVFYQQTTEESRKQKDVSEKTIRDLAARISDRIGIDYKIEDNPENKYKGKIENNIAYINLAYATLDTPIHEILGHPIVRTLKTGTTQNKQLYQNLLKELETGRGKEVLDRIKSDYQYKRDLSVTKYSNDKDGITYHYYKEGDKYYKSGEEITKDEFYDRYSLEEQQEEAIVELLGLYTAGKLDKVKDGKLIGLLKRLLKEVKEFMRKLLKQKDINIDSLPDNMTLNDLADLLAYSNSKLILPGNEVIYITPDNETFKTYQEASNYISELIKLAEVNLNYVTHKITIKNTPKEFKDGFFTYKYNAQNKQWFEIFYEGVFKGEPTGKILTEDDIVKRWKRVYSNSHINQFINKNEEYEESKEIIEEWKKVNDIKYDPEEVYSRGQGFYSVVGAYSDFDVKLMFQNLLAHIEDNKKAGGEFTISAFTKPVDKQIGHLEGGGGKIKFKIYPKSKDIKWAANKDVYSGSVWDAAAKTDTTKSSEVIGVSYSKYPALNAVDAVQPNLANIIDNLAYHHNELGIELTGDNFRLEYDDDLPYATKKILNTVNNILNERYGKLVEPEIKQRLNKKDLKINFIKEVPNEEGGSGGWWVNFENGTSKKFDSKTALDSYINSIQSNYATQPTQTNENLKESIKSVQKRVKIKTENSSFLIKRVFRNFKEKLKNESLSIREKKFLKSIGFEDVFVLSDLEIINEINNYALDKTKTTITKEDYESLELKSQQIKDNLSFLKNEMTEIEKKLKKEKENYGFTEDTTMDGHSLIPYQEINDLRYSLSTDEPNEIFDKFVDDLENKLIEISSSSDLIYNVKRKDLNKYISFFGELKKNLGKIEKAAKNEIYKIDEILEGDIIFKEYTSQAEINTKVAALKHGKRKFQRSLIRSEVVKKPDNLDNAELSFQKISSEQTTNKITITPELLNRITEIIPAVRRTKKKTKIVEPEILSQSIETQSFSKSKPSGLKVLNAFAQELTKANPDIDVEFLTTEELSAKGIKNAKIVRGMAESDSNTIYINTDIAATSDLLHEFGHLLLQQLETVDSELYNSMVTAALEHPHAQSIARSYPELSEKRLGEEVFVTLLGEMTIEKVKTIEEKSWWNKFTDLFNSIVDKLFNITTRGSFKKSILDYSPEEVLKTPLEDVINVFAKDVLKGSLKVIQPKPKTELQRIAKDLKTLRDCI